MDPNLLKRIIGARITEYRWELAMEQKQLACDCGKDKAYMSRVEHGKVLPKTLTLNLIAEKLRKEAWQLMKPWENSGKRIEEIQFIVKKYNGKLPPFAFDSMEKRK